MIPRSDQHDDQIERSAGPLLGGLSARRAHGRGLRSYRDGPMDAAVGSARFPARSNESLEAQGYVLTAPLMRRPGVYLADVSAGPAGHQRLIIDARSGQILERFHRPWSKLGTRARRPRRRVWRASIQWRRTTTGPGLRRPARRKIGLRRSSERPYSRGRQPLRRRGNAGRKQGQAEVRCRRNARRPSTRLCRLPLHVKRREWTDQARRRSSRPRTTIPSSRGSTPIRPTSATASRPPRPQLKARPPRRATSRR